MSSPFKEPRSGQFMIKLSKTERELLESVATERAQSMRDVLMDGLRLLATRPSVVGQLADIERRLASLEDRLLKGT